MHTLYLRGLPLFFVTSRRHLVCGLLLDQGGRFVWSLRSRKIRLSKGVCSQRCLPLSNPFTHPHAFLPVALSFLAFSVLFLSLSKPSTSGTLLLGDEDGEERREEENRRWHPCPWLARENTCLRVAMMQTRGGDSSAKRKNERGTPDERVNEEVRGGNATWNHNVEYIYNYNTVLVLRVQSAWNRVECGGCKEGCALSGWLAGCW